MIWAALYFTGYVVFALAEIAFAAYHREIHEVADVTQYFFVAFVWPHIWLGMAVGIVYMAMTKIIELTKGRTSSAASF